MLNYLKKRFPGISANSRKLISDLADLLPEAERNDFKERHGNLGNDVIVSNAKAQKGSASKLVGLLSDWALCQHRHGKLAELPTTEDLLKAETGAKLFPK